MRQARLAFHNLLSQLFKRICIVYGVFVARHEGVEAAVRRIADAQIVPPIDRLFVKPPQVVIGWRRCVRRL